MSQRCKGLEHFILNQRLYPRTFVLFRCIQDGDMLFVKIVPNREFFIKKGKTKKKKDERNKNVNSNSRNTFPSVFGIVDKSTALIVAFVIIQV